MQEISQQRLARGYAIALGCAAVLSTTAVFIRYLTVTYGMPALVLASWRDALAALVLLPILLWKCPKKLHLEPRQLRYLLGYGLVFAGFNAFWTMSVAENGAAVATVLVYCSTAFTALLGRWLLHERLDGVKVMVILLALGGCLLVAGAADSAAWQTGWSGIAAGLLSGLGYAGYSLLGRGAATEHQLDPWVTLFYTFSFATAFLVLLNALSVGHLPGTAAGWSSFFWLGDAWAGWGVLALLAAGPTVLGFGLYNVSLVYLPSSIVNLVATSEPVFTAAISYCLLGERLSRQQLLGSAIVLAGVVALRLHEGWRARRLPTQMVGEVI